MELPVEQCDISICSIFSLSFAARVKFSKNNNNNNNKKERICSMPMILLLLNRSCRAFSKERKINERNIIILLLFSSHGKLCFAENKTFNVYFIIIIVCPCAAAHTKRLFIITPEYTARNTMTQMTATTTKKWTQNIIMIYESIWLLMAAAGILFSKIAKYIFHSVSGFCAKLKKNEWFRAQCATL